MVIPILVALFKVYKFRTYQGLQEVSKLLVTFVTDALTYQQYFSAAQHMQVSQTNYCSAVQLHYCTTSFVFIAITAAIK